MAALFAVSALSGAQATKTPPEKPMPKKGMPMRDSKTGRFTSKAKALPARDPKTGRFVAKSHAKGKAAAKRDPKTGRFVKTKG